MSETKSISSQANSCTEPGFNFAYLDEQTKRSICRAILKAVAIPGHQIPFSSREMPMSYNYSTEKFR